MAPKYQLNLMFEWRGGCLWCANEIAREHFGVGSIEESLPLAESTLHRLQEMTEWHDSSLNWDYPPDPGPWSPTEYQSFDTAAFRILETIQNELGHDFEIKYIQLGSPSA